MPVNVPTSLVSISESGDIFVLTVKRSLAGSKIEVHTSANLLAIRQAKPPSLATFVEAILMSSERRVRTVIAKVT